MHACMQRSFVTPAERLASQPTDRTVSVCYFLIPLSLILRICCSSSWRPAAMLVVAGEDAKIWPRLTRRDHRSPKVRPEAERRINDFLLRMGGLCMQGLLSVWQSFRPVKEITHNLTISNLPIGGFNGDTTLTLMKLVRKKDKSYKFSQ